MDADAIIIGAGAAGLAAARSLAGRALRVIVLEARDRIGGRVWSLPSARAVVPIELGAEFIHGPADETMALLRDTGTGAFAIGGESWTSDDDGPLQRDEDDFRSAGSIFERARALADDESVDALLRRFDGDATMRKEIDAARAFVEGFEAADPALASAQAIANELRSGVDSTSARPIGGYRPLFERLLDTGAEAGVATYLSTVVRRVCWKPGAVAVETYDDRGEERTFCARAAIVTLPVGVLRRARDEGAVEFDPNLPSPKRNGLNHLEMGHAIKVSLWFRTAFWERVCDGRYSLSSFFRKTGQPFAAYWTQFPVHGELIVAWAGGPKATALQGMSQSDLIAQALDGFGALLGEPELARAEFSSGVTHDWSNDPFARGAYSYVAVGGGNARATLAAPAGDTLFFAGEATSNDGQGGTVNGALETGERAAREAAAVLGAPVG